MQNVTLRLLQSHSTNSPLACIHFIKSHLTIETFSNFCQDIDLVSQEILIVDTRFHGTEEKQSNVFTNILQPVRHSMEKDIVQAEVHSRKRLEYTKVTILLNNIRLMAIFDWWEKVKEYIFQDIENLSSSPEHKIVSNKPVENMQFDLKLNVTDSEIVVVEDASQWDSNAVILKVKYSIKYNMWFMVN